jgi:dihydroorotase
MQAHQFTPQEIARVGAYNPAQFFNQFSNYQYGKIAKGFVGSLTIIDMHRPITITKALLKTKAQWSPFEGVTFPGSVAYTIVKGKVYKNL